MPTYLTSKDNFHTHTWNERNKNTSYDFNHDHPINISRMIAMRGKTSHTHKLLRREVKK